MKTFLQQIGLLLSLLVPLAVCRAQPVITANAMVNLGESAPVQFAQGNFNPGPSGANVTWDFSSLQDDTLAFTWEALSPSNSPFQDSFPNANMAFRSPIQTGLQENWIYYEWDAGAQTLDLHGSAAIISDTAGQDTFYYVLTPNPKLVQTFPFTYNDNYTDNFSGRSTISIGGFTLVQTRTGTITVTGDAYGSLVTPAGSFQNVLRVKTTEQITDSYMGFTTTQSITRYTWYSANEKYLLLHMDSIVIQPQGGPANTTESIFYRDGSPVVSAAEAILADQWGLEVFPNPTTGHIRLRYQLDDPAPARIVVCNLIGQELRQFPAENGPQSRKMDLDELPAGIYTIQLQQAGSIATRKLILH